jgi:hypothetical protein
MKKEIYLPGYTACKGLNDKSLDFSSLRHYRSSEYNFRAKYSHILLSADNEVGDGCGSSCASDNGDETCCCEVGMKCVKTAGWCGCKDASALTSNRSAFSTRSNNSQLIK